MGDKGREWARGRGAERGDLSRWRGSAWASVEFAEKTQNVAGMGGRWARHRWARLG